MDDMPQTQAFASDSDDGDEPDYFSQPPSQPPPLKPTKPLPPVPDAGYDSGEDLFEMAEEEGDEYGDEDKVDTRPDPEAQGTIEKDSPDVESESDEDVILSQAQDEEPEAKETVAKAPVPDNTNPLPLHMLGLDFTFWAHTSICSTDTPYETSGYAVSWSNVTKKNGLSDTHVSSSRDGSNVRFLVDDGTGVVSCIYWFSPTERERSIRSVYKLGTLVSILGRITVYRDARQVQIFHSNDERDPNTETLWRLQCVLNYKNAYSVKSIIPERLGDIALKEAARRELEEKDLFAPVSERFTVQEIRKRAGDLRETLEKIKAEVTNDDFYELLCLHIMAYANLPTFLYTDIRRMPELADAAKKVALAQPKPREDRLAKLLENRQVDSVFQKAFGRLVKDGHAYVSDEETDSYCIIRHDFNLGKAVLDIVRSPTAVSVSNSEGVTEEVVVMILCRDPRFEHVRRAKIQKSLSALAQASLIYEVGFKQYRAFEDDIPI
ncbi:hypothetical protein HDU96_005019 [Phlyctochytrium bullatum]|nr:hypothetical protein HDU96_005019 [Phlyctochytrium bullatum]